MDQLFNISNALESNQQFSRTTFGYSAETPPEAVVSDYNNAWKRYTEAQENLAFVAQGTKYFKVLDMVDYYGSKDDLEIAIGSLGKAANLLYQQDDAAKSYSSANLDLLIPLARADFEASTE